MTDYTIAKSGVVMTFPFKFNSTVAVTVNDWILIRFLIIY